jgi:hypothetical protein
MILPSYAPRPDNSQYSGSSGQGVNAIKLPRLRTARDLSVIRIERRGRVARVDRVPDRSGAFGIRPRNDTSVSAQGDRRHDPQE